MKPVITPLLFSLLITFSTSSGLPASNSLQNNVLVSVLLYDRSATSGDAQARAYLRDAFTRLEKRGMVSVTASRNDSVFLGKLDTFDLIVLAYGNGDVIDSSLQERMIGHVTAGGTVLVVHSAGSHFNNAPLLEKVAVPYRGGMVPNVKAVVRPDAQVQRNPDGFPLLRGLLDPVELKDRWLVFGGLSPTPEANVILRVDELAYRGHVERNIPVLWEQRIGTGKVVFNALGKEDVYRQANGYGDQILENLAVTLLSSKRDVNGAEARPFGDKTSLYRFVFSQSMLTFDLPAGVHQVQVYDQRGRVMMRRAYEGPRQVQFEVPIHSSILIVSGPQGAEKIRLI